MIARQVVWSNPKIQELAKQFVPAADEVWALQNRPGPERDLFRQVSEKGHYGGRTFPTDTRQGTYALSPSGEFLASANTNDPDAMAAMLAKALDAWKALSKGERLRPEPPDPVSADRARLERMYPKDGLVLRVISRDVDRAEAEAGWRGRAWNMDFAWFRADEVARMLPDDVREAQAYEVPQDLVRRLTRCHFVDNVRGQTSLFREERVQVAKLTATVSRIRGGMASVRFSGSSVAAESGTWSVNGFHDAAEPTKQTRGIDVQILGRAEFDLKRRRFESFELVAVGLRWGGTQYNGRGDDLSPAPIGFLLSKAGDSPAERVAPAFVWAYGWADSR